LKTHRTGGSRVVATVGLVVIGLGVVFLVFAIAPQVIPGGVPTGILEYGGNHANIIEAVGGALIVLIGAAIRRFGSSHKVIAAASVVLVFFLGIISAFSSINSSFVITTVEITIEYGPNDQGYFGPTQQAVAVTSQPDQNLTVDEGSSFKLSFSLRESALATGGDGIASIKASNPDYSFSVNSVNPSLPVNFSPGMTTQITVSLTAPFYNLGQTTPFNGVITLVLTTTGG
jgi:hypothetical protein